MSKRYQVFVSSTYADLKEERRKVIQTLLEMDCIPTGMELFPAIDEEQYEFIKKVINDCDYYMLIIGGRYGTVTPEGISYTEMEYEYALSRGIKVVAFLHENPDDIPVGKSDIGPELRERLMKFREKVSDGRLVKFYNAAEELPGLVALSLTKTIKTYPAVGWVRGDKTSSEEILNEINELRKENQKLQSKMSGMTREETIDIPNLATLDEPFLLRGKYSDSFTGKYTDWVAKTTWREIFTYIAPYLLRYPNEDYVKGVLGRAAFVKSGRDGHNENMDDQLFQTVKIQLMAIKLINVQYTKTIAGGMDLFWSLTSKGQEMLMHLRTIRSTDSA